MNPRAISGGILVLIGAIAYISFWAFIINPVLTLSQSITQIYTTLKILEALGFSLVNWSDVILFDLTVEQIFILAMFITNIPASSINFFNIITLDMNLCAMFLAGILGLGGILALAGGGSED